MKVKHYKIVSLLWVSILLLTLLAYAGCAKKPPAPAANVPTDTAAATAVTESPIEASPTPEEETPVVTGDFRRKSNRDPFIPPIKPWEDPNKPKPPVVITTQTTAAPTRVISKGPQTIEVGPETVGIEVAGIMKVGSGYTAILTNKATKKGYVVSTGQKLGEWTVASITADTVTLKATQNKNIYVARLILKEDFKTTGPGPKAGNIPTPDAGPRVPGSGGP